MITLVVISVLSVLGRQLLGPEQLKSGIAGHGYSLGQRLRYITLRLSKMDLQQKEIASTVDSCPGKELFPVSTILLL